MELLSGKFGISRKVSSSLSYHRWPHSILVCLSVQKDLNTKFLPEKSYTLSPVVSPIANRSEICDFFYWPGTNRAHSKFVLKKRSIKHRSKLFALQGNSLGSLRDLQEDLVKSRVPLEPIRRPPVLTSGHFQRVQLDRQLK